MASPANSVEIKPLGLKPALVFLLAAVASFFLAYSFMALSFLIVVYLYCLISLARVRTNRHAFYFGLAVGMLIYSIQMTCLYTIFGWAAIALWFVLAFWLGLFVVLARLCFANLTPVCAAMLIPFIWTGLEYFRSELYYLRFSWLNVGYAFAGHAYCLTLKWCGAYGFGFVLVALLSGFRLLPRRTSCLTHLLLLLALGFVVVVPAPLGQLTADDTPGQIVRVAGVQLEFPTETEILSNLDKLAEKKPPAELFVLSEYTLDGPPTEKIKAWCRERKRYLMIGGKDPVSTLDSQPSTLNQFYDTAFVIDPTGEIIFRQVKAVPVQFLKDGLPATEQKLWDSPWGKIGVCICYDLSYSRVTDRLIRLGAQAIICPTMDVIDWGEREHELHARVAPVRAAEYGVPIFRVASSGISQLVDSSGFVIASAPFPGEGAINVGFLRLHRPGQLPLDRILAPICVAVTGILIVGLTLGSFKRRFLRKSEA